MRLRPTRVEKDIAFPWLILGGALLVVFGLIVLATALFGITSRPRVPAALGVVVGTIGVLAGASWYRPDPISTRRVPDSEDSGWTDH